MAAAAALAAARAKAPGGIQQPPPAAMRRNSRDSQPERALSPQENNPAPRRASTNSLGGILGVTQQASALQQQSTSQQDTKQQQQQVVQSQSTKMQSSNVAGLCYPQSAPFTDSYQQQQQQQDYIGLGALTGINDSQNQFLSSRMDSRPERDHAHSRRQQDFGIERSSLNLGGGGSSYLGNVSQHSSGFGIPLQQQQSSSSSWTPKQQIPNGQRFRQQESSSFQAKTRGVPLFLASDNASTWNTGTPEGSSIWSVGYVSQNAASGWGNEGVDNNSSAFETDWNNRLHNNPLGSTGQSDPLFDSSAMAAAAATSVLSDVDPPPTTRHDMREPENNRSTLHSEDNPLLRPKPPSIYGSSFWIHPGNDDSVWGAPPPRTASSSFL